MRRITIFAVGCVLAATALGQQPPLKQSGGPTSNEARIRIVEPSEGAVLVGNDFNLVIQDQQFPSGTAVSADAQRDAVRPVYQLFVDDNDQGNVPMANNVVVVHTTTFGPHKVILLAKNGAGQVIDRKELNVVTSAGTATASTAPAQPETTTMSRVAPAPAAPVAAAPAPAPVAPAAPPASASSETLPATGTGYPAAAAAGVLLFATGAVIRRRRV
jgi:LPXTG-motif cell wall-anchored protein